MWKLFFSSVEVSIAKPQGSHIMAGGRASVAQMHIVVYLYRFFSLDWISFHTPPSKTAPLLQDSCKPTLSAGGAGRELAGGDRG